MACAKSNTQLPATGRFKAARRRTEGWGSVGAARQRQRQRRRRGERGAAVALHNDRFARLAPRDAAAAATAFRARAHGLTHRRRAQNRAAERTHLGVCGRLTAVHGVWSERGCVSAASPVKYVKKPGATRTHGRDEEVMKQRCVCECLQMCLRCAAITESKSVTCAPSEEPCCALSSSSPRQQTSCSRASCSA